MPDPDIVVSHSVTRLDERHRGNVLVAGSHGGIYAGYLAAKAGVRAVILNDAGVGKDEAGIGALAWLDGIGLAAAAVAHTSARIGDGADMAERGVISHVNAAAGRAGCKPGISVAACAEAMRGAPVPTAAPPEYAEARFLLHGDPGEPQVWGIDSVSLIGEDDARNVVLTGSHGGLLGGDPASAVRRPVRAACFNDAGVGADQAGIGRLPALDQRGVAAATVAAASARIGDARSMWETGVISHVNRTAAAIGLRPGQTARAFALQVLAHASGTGTTRL